eukprot:jgi/Tetstr1/444417/TSEL_032305.t1
MPRDPHTLVWIAAAADPATQASDDMFNPPRPRRISHPVPFDNLNLEQLGQFYKRAAQIWEASSTLSYHGAAVASAADAVMAIEARHQHAMRKTKRCLLPSQLDE